MSNDLSSGLGPRLDAADLRKTLDGLLRSAQAVERRTGRRPSPVCVWGTHGIGKTTLVEDLCRENGWGFAYCAPAQFEEMGDLHGLPILAEGPGGKRTGFAPPTWVPQGPGPGVLLLDDMNRADDRILRGLMQLLQRYGMMSWALPEGWHIVATANPEGGDYSVTPMDAAMLDRMLHFTLRFDAKAWAAWAQRSGVDPRGISFVLQYPEAVAGERTTPRSLARFFDLLADVPDLRAELERVRTLGLAVLDAATVSSFCAFAADGLAELLEPAEILDAVDGAALDARVQALAREGEVVRVDRLAVLCTRLVLALTAPGYAPGPRHKANLLRFLLHADLPADLVKTTHMDLTAGGGAAVKDMLKDPKLALRILEAMSR